MKNTLKVIAIITATAALLTATYLTGHKAGVKHAIEDAEIWLPEGYTTEEVKSWDDIDPAEIWLDLDTVDVPVDIYLDGQWYQHIAWAD